MIKQFIKYNKPERTQIYSEEIHNICKEVYERLKGDYDNITVIMRNVFLEHGFLIMSMIFTIVTNTIDPFIEDREIALTAEWILHEKMEGIGGWVP